MCKESPSINNKNGCLRACPRGLISSVDPRPCHWDGSLRLEPIARGHWLLVLYPVCSGSITTHTSIHMHIIIHASASFSHASRTLKLTCADSRYSFILKKEECRQSPQGLSRQIWEANTVQECIQFFLLDSFYSEGGKQKVSCFWHSSDLNRQRRKYGLKQKAECQLCFQYYCIYIDHLTMVNIQYVTTY